MKKSIFVCVAVTLTFLVPSLLLSSENGRSFSVGASVAGTAIQHGEFAYLWGAEVGWRFSDRLGANLEIASAKKAQEWELEAPSATANGTAVDKMLPITLSLLYRNSLGKGGEVYSGFGVGFYFLKESEHATSQSLYQGVNKSDAEWSGSALAPHVCLGLEAGIRGGLRLFGEVRYVVGAVSAEKTDAYQTVKSDLSFGGAQVKCGFRLYF